MALNQNEGAGSKGDAENGKKHNAQRSHLAPQSAFFKNY